MLHGHSHRGRQQELEDCFKEQIRAAGLHCEAYNVGAMWQDYRPQTLEEIILRLGREIDLEHENKGKRQRSFEQ